MFSLSSCSKVQFEMHVWPIEAPGRYKNTCNSDAIITKNLRMLIVSVVTQVEPCQALSGPEERPRRPEEGQLPPGSGTGGGRLRRRSAPAKT